MLKSIDELAQIQKEHEERMEAERLRKEAEEKAERERREKALEMLNSLHNKNKDLENAQKELDAFEDSNIKERINESEEIKQILKEKEEQLENLKTENSQIADRIDAIMRIIEGKKYVAPELQEELKNSKETDNKMKEEIQNLNNSIENIRAKIVTEEEISNYEQVLDKVYMLRSQIKEIEENADVKEFLAEEIKQKTDMVNFVIDAGINSSKIIQKNELSNEENEELYNSRQEYVKKICEQFLKEEIESRQIDSIKERDKRLDAYKKVSKFLTIGLTNHDFKNIKFSQDSEKIERSLAYAGLSMANLVGNCATKGGIINILAHEISEEEKSSKIEKSHKEYAIKIHYKTLNILSAYSGEIGKSKFGYMVLGEAKNFDLKKIKNEFSEISINDEGMIIPKKISQSDKSEAKKIFDIHRSIAMEINDKINSALERKKEEKAEKINLEINELNNNLAKIEMIEKELKEYSMQNINNEENKIKEILANKELRLSTAKMEYENTLLLNISKRSDLSKEIKDLEDFIINLKKNLKEVDYKKNNYKKSKDDLDNLIKDFGTSQEIKDKISNLESSLK